MHALRRLSLPLAALVLSLPSATTGQEVRFGSPHALGEGAVRTYAILDADGRVSELGYAIDEAAIRTLPPGDDFVVSPDPLLEAPFLTMDLPLPEGHGTPFRFAMFDWNPKGHPPVMYELAHFDFHFYMIDPAERDAILATDAAELDLRGGRAPEVGLLPANYVYPGRASVMKMGGHWIDPASHEFHGQEFDRTFIYGTWDGRVIFIEPMITRAFLESRGEATQAIALPERWASTGRYPTGYRVYHDAASGQHRVALTGFEDRP